MTQDWIRSRSSSSTGCPDQSSGRRRPVWRAPAEDRLVVRGLDQADVHRSETWVVPHVLQSVFAPEPGAGASDELLSAAIKPSRQLMAPAATEVRDRERVRSRRSAAGGPFHGDASVNRCRTASTKHVVIVTGRLARGKASSRQACSASSQGRDAAERRRPVAPSPYTRSPCMTGHLVEHGPLAAPNTWIHSRKTTYAFDA